jgi:hypothetical protein
MLPIVAQVQEEVQTQVHISIEIKIDRLSAAALRTSAVKRTVAGTRARMLAIRQYVVENWGDNAEVAAHNFDTWLKKIRHEFEKEQASLQPLVH